MHNPLHVHDYEMEFPSENAPLDWVMRCRCGDSVTSMAEALTKTLHSHERRFFAVVTISALAGLIIAVLIVYLTAVHHA